MGELCKDIPKVMVPVYGIPLLQRTLEFVARQGVLRVELLAGHLSEYIEKWLAAHPTPLEVSIHKEQEPLGTAGALHAVSGRLDENFLLLYGDIYVDFDVRSMLEQHTADGALATLLVRESDHPWDSDLLKTDEDGAVLGLVREREEGKLYRNVANAAVYVLSRRVLRYVPVGVSSDYVKDVFPAALNAGERLLTHQLEWSGYVKDMGTPKRLAEVEKHLSNRELISNAQERRGRIKTVFLDRDGTINKECGHITDPSHLELLPGAAEGIRRMCESGLECIVVTNQPAIARGLCDEQQLGLIHERLIELLEAEGAHIRAIYHSPFHPETHHGEGVPSLRRASACRKPGNGMIMQAVEELGVDLAESVIVGDTDRDMKAGRLSGLTTILIDGSNRDKSGAIAFADHCSGNLIEVAELLNTLNQSPNPNNGN